MYHRKGCEHRRRWIPENSFCREPGRDGRADRGSQKLRRQSGMLLADLFDEYIKQPDRPDSSEKTLKERQAQCKHFVEWMANYHPEAKRVADVSEDIARDYFAFVWKRGVSARTYNIYLAGMRLFFKYLRKPAALEGNPFDDIPKKDEETASRREFTPEQIDAIFSGFETGFFYESEVEKLTTGRKRERAIERLQYHPMNAAEMRVLLNLCCWTGCRGQDGCLMQWRNIDMERRQISYIPRKTARKTNHKAVTLPMHPALVDALRGALEWRENNKAGEDYVLPAVADRYKRNPSGIQKDVMKIIRCATGMDTTVGTDETFGRRKLAANAYSLHSFRHTFVSFCANAGVPLAIVAEIVGHGNPAMTRHYSHITTEAKRGAIDALPVIGATATAITDGQLEREELRRLADALLLDKIKDILNYISEITEA